MTEAEVWHLNYSIAFNNRALEEDRALLQMAYDQLRRHHQELNIRRKAISARQSIEYLTKKFIPDIQEEIAMIERLIEIRKLQLTGLTYEEAEAFLEAGASERQLELFG
ncbi:hypothetical protein [Brevibacillus sp. HD3.3A]|uniref:hypothetical protein n=1 Tax=Brevibacillus sp. HD3.3A TaxID=2738979 RepID=UPI00156B74DF|nr:hypothetical protein [Brevibacillus sp. HD3.3A]UED70746.1 hypothetical protein HP435_08945 [Brevibacillus sp. HD3.3A]UED72124.1 hypothetical protein HP435_28885 [Brevibacillus sp. HD3.3A]